MEGWEQEGVFGTCPGSPGSGRVPECCDMKKDKPKQIKSGEQVLLSGERHWGIIDFDGWY